MSASLFFNVSFITVVRMLFAKTLLLKKVFVCVPPIMIVFGVFEAAI